MMILADLVDIVVDFMRMLDNQSILRYYISNDVDSDDDDTDDKYDHFDDEDDDKNNFNLDYDKIRYDTDEVDDNT